ncbi:MAG TPA: FAD-dependent 5-carboxymethylaminomethyl-2-thiouridine(34) oxidoreductase MnmC [Ramlibacter sp.]|nr:FAD-dependent 5-carboxymethylaminomethyl-2-thiouridine(34) oxidoreductase MnmC [Ramlibacter sp.]
MLLPGGRLPGAWAGRNDWRILEAGFGFGADFLVAWDTWRRDAQRPRLLHFVSLVPSPPAAADLRHGAGAAPELAALREQLRAQWQGLVPGFHRLAFEGGRVLLTLCIGEPAAMLRELSFRADSVLLRGAPHAIDTTPRNLALVKALTRLSRRGATLAGDAGDPRLLQDFQSCGWQLEANHGAMESGSFAGRYEPAWEVKGLHEADPAKPGDCVVIGAGLAGAAAAASLARRGWKVRVLDAAAQPAAGASSLPAGLLAPHQSPDDNLLSRLSRAGVRITLREARQRLAPGLEWEATGVLEWRGDDARPLPVLGEGLAVWSREATGGQKAAAGIAPAATAWWHENAAWIEPAALVRSWLREPGVQFIGGRRIARIVRASQGWRLLDAHGEAIVQAPLVVVAAALQSAPLLDDRITLHPVRGQVTWGAHADDASALPPFPINGHGHFLPRVPLVDRGAWITGSTYGRGDSDASVRGEDAAANVERVREVLPRAGEVLRGAAARGDLRAWSGVRCASSDRRPLLGEVEAGLWVSTAMGSRGLTFAALCGEILAARLHGEPLPVEARLAQALDAARQLRSG